MKAKVPTFPFAVPRKINDGRLPRDFDPWESVPVIRVIHKRPGLRDKNKIVKDEFRFPSATSPSFHREYNPETGVSIITCPIAYSDNIEDRIPWSLQGLVWIEPNKDDPSGCTALVQMELREGKEDSIDVDFEWDEVSSRGFPRPFNTERFLKYTLGQH